MGEESEQQGGPDLGGAQLGDYSARDNAGGNIYHGAELSELRAFIRDYVFLSDQQSELYREELQRQMRAVHIELWLLRIIIAALIVGYMLIGR